MREKTINFIIALVGILVGACVVYVVIANPFDKEETSGALGCQYTSCTNKVVVDNTGISEAVKKVYDAVVMIQNYKSNTLQGSGSGFVYKVDSKYGYIMTNQHVVEGSTSLKVRLSNEKTVDATLLGGDDYLDIAIIRIPVSEVITTVTIGKTSDLKLGGFVFTIGSPVGEEYFNTVTSGIISGLNRQVTVSVKSSNDWVMDVLQVDAAINPGNSGGPLLNSNGEVIGVNSLKLVDSQIEGMGFAIKIEDAMAHIDELESGKNIERPLLGINLVSVTDKNLLYRYGISINDDIEYGIVVISVVEDTGAAKSDLKKGDVITAIDGEKVTNAAYLKYILYKYKSGDEIKVTYSRDGKEKTTKVILTKSED